MKDLDFNTPAGQPIDRELLVMCINADKTAPKPKWSPAGSRVPDSSEEIDWSKDTSTDILGKVRTTMKKPVTTQSFDPLPLDAEDPVAKLLWNLAIRKQDAAALSNMDVLICHYYAGDPKTGMFAERYDGSAVEVTGLGGEGGGSLSMPTTVTPGGNRTIGLFTVDDSGEITFVPDTENDTEPAAVGA